MFVVLSSILEASHAFTYVNLPHRLVRRANISTRLHASNAKDTSNHEKEDPRNKVTVTFETADKTEEISINKGEILRSAMLKRDKSPHNGRARLINCRGT